MSLSFNSISEVAISELSVEQVIADLNIELFIDHSFTFVQPDTTASLLLNFSNNEIYAIYYGGSTATWVASLESEISDQVQQIFNFIDNVELEISDNSITSSTLNYVEEFAQNLTILETINSRYEQPLGEISLSSSINSIEIPSWLISTPTILSIDGEFINNLKLLSQETIGLSLEIVEKKFDDDVPSEFWRDRPGLPIAPISFNSIGVEQSLGPIAKSFPDISLGNLEINLEFVTSSTVSSIDSGLLDINDNDEFSVSYKFVDVGNLTTINISDKITSLNSIDSAELIILGNDTIQQIFKFEETLITNFASSDLTSISYNDNNIGILDIDFKTFTKEYTFLQQISSINNINISIQIESMEIFKLGSPSVSSAPRQIWFG
jgi:hypothetical protein